MKETKIISAKKEIIDDILCDICGRSCKVHSHIIDNPVRIDHGEPDNMFSCMTLSAEWGYFSNKDGEKWKAHVCEKCVDDNFSFIKFDKKTGYL